MKSQIQIWCIVPSHHSGPMSGTGKLQPESSGEEEEVDSYIIAALLVSVCP